MILLIQSTIMIHPARLFPKLNPEHKYLPLVTARTSKKKVWQYGYHVVLQLAGVHRPGKCSVQHIAGTALEEKSYNLHPTRTRMERQGRSNSSGLACFLASSMFARIRSSSISSAFVRGSRSGKAHPRSVNEYQREMRRCMSLE